MWKTKSDIRYNLKFDSKIINIYTHINIHIHIFDE
jgi:hypothetical protein